MKNIWNTTYYNKDQCIKNANDLTLEKTYILQDLNYDTEVEFCLTNIDVSMCNFKARIKYYLLSSWFYILRKLYTFSKHSHLKHKYAFLGFFISGRIITKSRWKMLKVNPGYKFEKYWINVNTKKNMSLMSTKIIILN